MTRAAAAPSLSFEADTVQALTHVRGLFSQLVEFKCPADKSVSKIATSFRVHRKLAWQVGKVAYSSDPFIAARHMPSPKSLEVWLKAAAKAGCPTPIVEEATSAAKRFHSLAATHSRTEQEFEMLLESCAGADETAHLKWRQQSFHGNSFVWGAHCKVVLSMMILQPSLDRDRYFHVAQVRGLLGFRQTRANVRWLINQSVVADDQAKTLTTLVRQPLDPDAAKANSGVPVLPRFCSSPMPQFTRRITPTGMVHDEFLSGPIGRAGERTLITAEIIRNLGLAHATDDDKVAHFGSGIRIPTELLHLDLFVHHSLFPNVQRELVMFSDINNDVAFENTDSLPLPEKIQPLGRGVSLAHSPDVPAYPELASSIFQSLDADPSDYELHRIRVPFPPMPVSIMVKHPLPPLEDSPKQTSLS